MPNVKNTILERLLTLVAPHLCSGCGQIGSTFCDNCKYNIMVEPFSGCILCEKPTDSGICNDHKVAFNQAWAVGIRNGALQRLIGGYKFRNMKESARELAYLLDARLPTLPRDAIFVPIPTSPPHIRERGYDHMLLVAQLLAQRRRRPLAQVLERANTLTQHHADRNARFQQAKTAYVLAKPVDIDKVYILIDDILTTGATIQAAAQLLYDAGATVWVAIIAKQPLD